MKTTKLFSLFIACIAMLSLQVNAQSPTAPAQGFNVFTQHGATFTQSECEGPVAVGGDLTLQGTYNFSIHNNFVYTVGGLNIGLLVGGKINYTSGSSFQVEQNGYVKIGDGTGSYVWYNYSGNNIRVTQNNGVGYSNNYPDIELNNNASGFGGVSASNNPVIQSGLINFATQFSTLQSTATSIGACTDNANIYNSPNQNAVAISHTSIPSGSNLYIQLHSGTNVLNLTGADLDHISGMTFQPQAPDASHILVINVNASGSYNWESWNNAGVSESNAPYILYNFYNTTSLTIDGNSNYICGTVFAPFAAITKTTNSGVIAGQVIADSYIQTGQGEIHSENFVPAVSGCSVAVSAPVAAFTINTSTQCLSGNSFTFTNTSTGTGNTYSWDFGDGTTSTSASPAKTYATANTYTVTLTATNTGGTNTATHNVTVNAAPAITTNPAATTAVCNGASVTYTAAASGTPAPTVQWQVSTNGGSTWNDITGQTSATYTFTAATSQNNNQYQAVFTNTCSTATTTAAVLPVNPSVTPSVSIGASGNNICAGTPVTFTATPVNGGSAPGYQWQKNGLNTGTNSNTYTDNALANNDAITCTLTGNAACATTNTANSNTITMTVSSHAARPAAFTASASIVYTGERNVTYTVPNTAGVTYTWSYSGAGATITGSTNSVTVTYSTTATSGNLSVTAANTTGCVTASDPRSIAITVKPYETWTCSGNNNWNNPANWDGGFVPYETINAYVPATALCQPVLTNIVNTYGLILDSGAIITINAGGLLAVNGDATINGWVTGTNKLYFCGDYNEQVSGKGTIDNLALQNASGVTILPGSDIHVGKTYTPNAGTLTTNGGLELVSDTSGTASIVTNNTGSCNYISGDVICDLYVHGTRRAFRFLGHPFSTSIPLSQLEQYIDITGQGGSANGFTTTTTNNPSAFWYNTLLGNGSTTDDSTGWTAFTNTNGVGANAWKRFEGLRILMRGAPGQGLGCGTCIPNPVTLKMHGPVNECDQTVTLTANSNAGYNFISNPFPSAIDMSLSTRGSAIGTNFSVWDPNQGVAGAYVDQPFNISYVLPAYSSFFTTAGSSSDKTITFHETDKTSATPTGHLFKTTSGMGSNAVQLHIYTNNDSLSWDRFLLFFNDDAAAGADAMDGQKLGNPDLDFYSYSTDGTQLAIDQRPYVNGQVIKLGLTTDINQTYTMKVEDYDVPQGGTLYLHDKYLNQVQPMQQGMRYTFDVTSDAASQGDNRFEINVNTTTAVANVNAAGSQLMVNMYPNPAADHVTVSFEAPAKDDASIVISNLVGQEVYSTNMGTVQAGKVNIPLNNLASGVYLITVKCGAQSVTKRCVKQ